MTKEEAIAYFAARRNYNPHNGNSEAERLALAALRAQQELEKNDPLTSDELREMAGKPAWCAECQCYGIVKIETIGCWANKPFLVGSWHDPTCGTAVDFEYDIEGRGLTLYRRKPEEDVR